MLFVGFYLFAIGWGFLCEDFGYNGVSNIKTSQKHPISYLLEPAWYIAYVIGGVSYWKKVPLWCPILTSFDVH